MQFVYAKTRKLKPYTQPRLIQSYKDTIGILASASDYIELNFSSTPCRNCGALYSSSPSSFVIIEHTPHYHKSIYMDISDCSNGKALGATESSDLEKEDAGSYPAPTINEAPQTIMQRHYCRFEGCGITRGYASIGDLNKDLVVLWMLQRQGR